MVSGFTWLTLRSISCCLTNVLEVVVAVLIAMLTRAMPCNSVIGFLGVCKMTAIKNIDKNI